MSLSHNPFIDDGDRTEIWTMLVPRDIAAFVRADWSMVEPDFVADEFFGLDGHKTANPDGWTIGFPTLQDYADEWKRQAREAQGVRYAENQEEAIHRATSLTEIEITGDRAVAHKKFDGSIALETGGVETLNWQTLYFCRKIDGRWKLTGFVGYLPNPMGQGAMASAAP